MNTRGLLLWLGVSFAVPMIVIAGCIAERDTYPNGEHRPPGGLAFLDSDEICGDNSIDTGESCDDGNEANGDGCSSTCQVEACWACSSGTCVPLAPNAPCNGAQVCDGKGVCGSCVPVEMACDKCKNCPGSVCDEASDCASTACVTGICRSAIGNTCTDPVECASNYCQSGALPVCAACVSGPQCMSGACDTTTGKCLAALGEPCDSSVKCASDLQCSAINICQGVTTASCTANYQCASNFCGINSCYACTEGKECVQGSICSNGVCPPITLPAGAYCVNSADCLSNNCTGFPRKCSP